MSNAPPETRPAHRLRSTTSSVSRETDTHSPAPALTRPTSLSGRHSLSTDSSRRISAIAASSAPRVSASVRLGGA
jgi:hypothetical protein